MNSLLKLLQRHWLWVIYFAFAAWAISSHTGEARFLSDGPYAAGKLITWIIFLLFLAYSLYVSAKENFFKSLGKMNSILWSRQVGFDLYIGLLIPMFIIYLHEGSLLVLAIWLLPILMFANLATLIYIALNYDGLIAHFI